MASRCKDGGDVADIDVVTKFETDGFVAAAFGDIGAAGQFPAPDKPLPQDRDIMQPFLHRIQAILPMAMPVVLVFVEGVGFRQVISFFIYRSGCYEGSALIDIQGDIALQADRIRVPCARGNIDGTAPGLRSSGNGFVDRVPVVGLAVAFGAVVAYVVDGAGSCGKNGSLCKEKDDAKDKEFFSYSLYTANLKTISLAIGGCY